MKNHLFRRILAMLLVAAMLMGHFVPGVSAADTGVTWRQTDAEVSLDQTDRLVQDHTEDSACKATDMVRVSIVLEEPSTVQAGFETMAIAQNPDAMAYNAKLHARQEVMALTISREVLNGKELDVVWNLTLVGNLISANVPYGKIGDIEALDGVKCVVVETAYEPCVISKAETAEPQMYVSTGMTGAKLVWSNGYTGAGIRIAVIDTGTDTDHQSLDNGAYLYALAENAAARNMSVEAYMDSLDLLDEEEIASVLEGLNIYEMDKSLTAQDLYINEKLAFGVNYVDENYRLELTHDNDPAGEHGSHVAGIATANRYIPDGTGGYLDAMESVGMSGVAPDAQLITMKVFGIQSGPFESDYMAAIEDAIMLGCDTVNLSLGSSNAGHTYSDYYEELLDYMTQTDTVVVCAAGNSGYWVEYAPRSSFLYAEDVNFDTVGSPASYTNMLSVASVDSDGSIGQGFTASGVDVVYNESTGFGNAAFSTLDTSGDGAGTEYGYVLIDGLGELADYEGIDLTGKVVFCSRGVTSFAVKANNAVSLGAAAVVIYNNTAGTFGMDLTGYNYTRPCVSILEDDADAIRAASARQTTADGVTYYTGTMTVRNKITGVSYGSEYYTMSSFSSWGVPGDLSIKPEITAPGGNIYSIYGSTPFGGGSDQYELMSGTSMAAPQITGMMALMAQFYRENDLDDTGMSMRHLSQSLLMSTAEPLRQEESGGNYYSILNQGSGMARVDLALDADSYILVEGQEDGKVKAELGDDPDRTGVYEFSFSIHNLTDESLDYTLRADMFRQDAFTSSGYELLDTWTAELEGSATFHANDVMICDTSVRADLNGDGVTDARDADFLLEYLLGNESVLHADGDISGDGKVNTYDAHYLLALLSSSSVVTVPANGSVTVEVTLALTDSDKEELDSTFENGTYVQAYVYVEAVPDAEGAIGTVHSIPVLAFYGSWTESGMFDHGTYAGILNGTMDKIPYLYDLIGCGNLVSYSDAEGQEVLLGGNPAVPDSEYHPERDAVNSETTTLDTLYFTPIRNAADAIVEIRNADTGEVYYSKDLGSVTSAFYYTNRGMWADVQQAARLNWSYVDAEGEPLPEGTNIEVSLTAAPEYYRNDDGSIRWDELGEGAAYTTRFTLDNTAPTARDITLDPQDANTLLVTARDENYIAALALLDTGGTQVLAYTGSNQSRAGETVTLEVDVSEVDGKEFLVAVYDYAYNITTYEVKLDLGEIQRDYFTAIDPGSQQFIGFDEDGTTTFLVSYGEPDVTPIAQAGEYVGGYIFSVNKDRSLWITEDAYLYNSRQVAVLDPKNEWQITNFCDMAYSHADGKLYVLFYSLRNDEAYPMLGTIDLQTCQLDVLGIMPVDVNTLAIDGEGNFYSATYAKLPSLYTYTAEQAMDGEMTYIGEITGAGYNNTTISSMAWDHNTDKLYWAQNAALYVMEPMTGEGEIVTHLDSYVVGLFIRPISGESLFDTTDQVSQVGLNTTDTTVLLGQTTQLQANVWPWNVSDDSVTWTSTDDRIATVNEDGVVTGVGVGSCVITAVSTLDPTVTASCTVTVFELAGKKLNALVWDENGDVWWSEIDTGDLSGYTKLTNAPADVSLASAAYLNGTLYAASLETTGLTSEVYTVDPETFELTGVGSGMIGYVDLAPTPNMDGGILAGIYGGYLLPINPNTGDYYGAYQFCENDLVGLAYVGSSAYQDASFDTTIDWYYLIDVEGYVYLMGFLAQDGEYYYMDHPSTQEGVVTQLDYTTETPYFCSAYFDGTYLYFSAYCENDNNVTLLMMDSANGNVYDLGSFPDGVWPVGGLFELGVSQNNTIEALDLDASALGEPRKLEPSSQKITAGSLNAVSGQAEAAPTSSAAKNDGNSTVTLTTPAAATNGTMTVSYDPDTMELVSVTGLSEAFAWTADDGVITVAYANARETDKGTAVGELVFDVISHTGATATVTHGELNEGVSDEVETLAVPGECLAAQYFDVNLNAWYHEAIDFVLEKGLMNGMDKTHFAPDIRMNRAQLVTVLYRMAGSPEVTGEMPFTDVAKGSFCYNAVIWAVQTGITTGVTSTTFEPGTSVNRAQMVTFLARYAKYAGLDVTPKGDLSGFTDADSVGNFARNAIIWAVENGLITGTSATTLSPNSYASRCQVATVLMRLWKLMNG